MATIDLSKLGLYLSKQKDKIIYLDLKEIENIIGKKLPPKATNPRWWYNVAQMKRAQTWLSNGYRTINSSYITARNGVEFERIHITFRSRIKYSRIFNVLLLYFIMPLFVAVSASIIVSFIDSSAKLNEKISVIEECFLSNDYDGIEEKIYEVIPQLEKNKKIYELCLLYDILVSINLDEYISANIQNKEDFYALTKTCQKALDYANVENNTLYQMRFLNYLGNLYQYQYSKTKETYYADGAIKYLGSSKELFMDLIDKAFDESKDMSKIKSVDELNLAVEGLTTFSLLFDVYYSLIENEEYSENDYINVPVENFSNNIFFKLNQSYGFTVLIIGYLARSDEFIDIIYNLHCDLLFHSLDFTSRLSTLYFILTSIYGENFIFSQETYSYEKVTSYLQQTVNYAQQRRDYYSLSLGYWSLARTNYINYIYGGNKDCLINFEKYLKLYLEITGRKDLTLREYDKYFITFSSGELLDNYLEELETVLTTVSFLDNPSFYSYTKRDLGRHYYLKALDLINQNDSNERIGNALKSAEECCNSALIYFTEKTNPRIFNEINDLKNDINEQWILLDDA